MHDIVWEIPNVSTNPNMNILVYRKHIFTLYLIGFNINDVEWTKLHYLGRILVMKIIATYESKNTNLEFSFIHTWVHFNFNLKNILVFISGCKYICVTLSKIFRGSKVGCYKKLVWCRMVYLPKPQDKCSTKCNCLTKYKYHLSQLVTYIQMEYCWMGP